MKRLLILVIVFVFSFFYSVVNAELPVFIEDFSPKEGKVGTEIIIIGENFNSSNDIYLGGTKVIPIEKDSNRIKIKVPVGAKTGKIYIPDSLSTDLFTVIENSTSVTGPQIENTTSSATIKDNGGTIDNTEFSGLVPKCGIVENGVIKNPCNFEYFMKLLNKLINFVLFVIATPLAAVIIAYAGFLYLSEGSNSGNLNKAKTILKNVVYGYIIALIAWLLVKLIMETLGYSGISFLA